MRYVWAWDIQILKGTTLDLYSLEAYLYGLSNHTLHNSLFSSHQPPPAFFTSQISEEGDPEDKNMCPTKERDEEIEKSLLGKDEEEGNAGDSSGITIALMIQEMKKLGYVAGPMVAVNLSQYFLQVIAVMMVGHLGELYLASTALAISFCAVTGFSVIVCLLLPPLLLLAIYC